MKKVLFLTTLLLISFTATTFAQSSKEARAAKREAIKKEREARRALEAQQDSIAYFKAVDEAIDKTLKAYTKNGELVVEDWDMFEQDLYTNANKELDKI